MLLSVGKFARLLLLVVYIWKAMQEEILGSYYIIDGGTFRIVKLISTQQL